MKSKEPWAGINSNERAFHNVRNALVGIILDGVQGVSPDTGVRQHSPDKADEILDRARRTLKDFESQKAQRGRTQRWMEHTTNELRRLIADAEAVRAGGPPKGVTHEAPTVASPLEEGGKQATKPGKHGTLRLWKITYKDLDNPAFGEAAFTKWAYDKQAAWDAFNEQTNEEGESWEIVKIEPVLDTGPKRLSKETPHTADFTKSQHYFTNGWNQIEPGIRVWVSGGEPTRLQISGNTKGREFAEGVVRTWWGSQALHFKWTDSRNADIGRDWTNMNRESQHVADFNTIDDLVKHARTEGATHVSNPSGVGSETKLYFPLRDGGYAEASVWRKEGYWHTQAPSVRTRVAKLPAGAQRIGGKRTAELFSEKEMHQIARSNHRALVTPYAEQTGAAESHLEAHRSPPDEQAAHELVLYIENESDLSPDGPSGQGRSVLLNALRKWRSGTYDSAKAVQLFAHLTEAGAKRYAKEFGSSEKEWSTMFTPATRHEAARQLEASFRNSVEQGEYDKIDTGRGARKTNAPHAAASRRRVAPRPTTWTTQNTRINTWFERDRASVVLETLDGTTIIEWWDEAVEEAVQDGFLDSSDWHGSAVKYANNVGAQPQKAREAPHAREDGDAHQAGADYAQEQVTSDHFHQWVWEQLSQAAKMDPDKVLPLETKADARTIARNMLQDLEWDTVQQYNPEVEDPKAFWAGFRETLRSSETRDWLADELLRMKSVAEKPAPEPRARAKHRTTGRSRPKAKRSAKRRR